MLSLQDIDDIVLNGGIVVDADGTKIGSVEQIFISADAGDPAFVTVRTGLFGMSETFVPLAGATLEESVVRVDFNKEKVRAGPRIDSERGSLTEAQERELYAYYGLGTAAGSASATPAESESGAEHDGAPAAQRTGERPDAATATVPSHGAPTAPGAPQGTPPPSPPPHLRRHVPVPPPAHPHPGPHPPGHPPGPPPHPPGPPPGLGAGPL
jgi:hypothetical protein